MSSSEGHRMIDRQQASAMAEDGAGDRGAGIESIPLKLQVLLGSAFMSVREAACLRAGSLVTLDRALGQPVDVAINGRVICRGEIAVTDEATPRFVVQNGVVVWRAK